MGFVQTPKIQRAIGTLFTNYTTAKSIINPQALWPIVQNGLGLGDYIEIDFNGAISNIVTTPGLMNFQVKIGAVAVYDSGNIQLNATAHTTLPFRGKIILTLDSEGSGTAAKFRGQGFFDGVMFTRTAAQTDGANTETTISAPATAPALGTGFDSTVAAALDLWAGFTIANAGNGVQIQNYKVTFHTERN